MFQDGKGRAACSSKTCGLVFCSTCLYSEHPGQPCRVVHVSTRSKTTSVVSSKKSKARLRRLWRRQRRYGMGSIVLVMIFIFYLHFDFWSSWHACKSPLAVLWKIFFSIISVNGRKTCAFYLLRNMQVVPEFSGIRGKEKLLAIIPLY